MLGTIRPTRTLFLIRHFRRNVSVAQNANAPTPIRDSLHDSPARDPPAKPVTRVRSSLHRLVPFAFVRFLMIFFIGVVSPLALQSFGRPAEGAPTIMCYFEDAAGRRRKECAPYCRRRYCETPPGEAGNVGSQPPPSALKSCTRFSDTYVVLVAYCCSAYSNVRSASSTVRKSPTPSL